MSLGVLLAILAALSVWTLASVAATVDAGRRWGWWWGLGVWLIWPVALFPWAIRRRREAAADRAARIRRPVGL